MSPISAAYRPEIADICALTVKDSVTSRKGMEDNTRRNDIPNDKHLLIAGAQAYLTSMKQEQTFTTIVEMPDAPPLPAGEFENRVMRRFSQTALQSIRSVLSGETIVFTAELSKMANLQFDLSQLCLHNYQSGLETNKNQLHELSLKNIEKMQEAIDQAAKSKAEQEKMGFWGKLSNILGVAAAIAGILLAPLTGGLSLLATGYLVVDLGLQIGEQTTGIKMSIESGLKKGIKAFLTALPQNVLSESQCDFIAGIVSSIVGMVLAIGMSVLSAGSGAPKIFSALLKFEKALAGSHKVSKVVQGTTHMGSAVTGATGAGIGLRNASTELFRSDIGAQQRELEAEKSLLMQAFEQCKDDSQKISEGMQRMLTQIADMLSTYYSGSIRIIDSMSKVRYAA